MVTASQSQKKKYSKELIKITIKYTAIKKILMASILDNLSRVRDVGRASSNGIMKKLSKENGEMVKKMGLENGNHQKEILMKDYGKIIDNLAKESISTMAVHIKANSLIS
jgi:hypothetical protein